MGYYTIAFAVGTACCVALSVYGGARVALGMLGSGLIVFVATSAMVYTGRMGLFIGMNISIYVVYLLSALLVMAGFVGLVPVFIKASGSGGAPR